MRKKVLLWVSLLSILITGCSSKADLYNMRIDVASKKEAGRDWDIMGGSPDIKVIVDKRPLPLSPSCVDTYRCNYSFSSVRDKWYIEVYDGDIDSDDLIGKGDCEEGEECNFGFAKILIED